MTLPRIITTITCGSCHENIHFDGENHRCDDCNIMWMTEDPFDDTEANFQDEDATPCGHDSQRPPHINVSPFHTIDSVVKVWRKWTHLTHPCHLPTGHLSDHNYPTTRSYTEHTEKP